MRTMNSRQWKTTGSVASMAAAAVLMSGCAGSFTGKTDAPVALVGPQLHGAVHGGRQPISGATLHLYAANATGTAPTGYGGANTDLLTSTVQTDPTGAFNITSKYTCTAGQQMYIVSLGGDPGSGVNAQAGLMAALGDCANLGASTYINMNEITTVGSVFALAPFMTSYAGVGTTTTNAAGLKQAFASVNKLVNIATGLAFGSALPAGATGPTTEINTLADVLSACVNSAGGVSGDGSVCGTIFANATPSGGTAPTDTIGAAMLIAKNPALNVTAQYIYATPQSPYAPRLTSAPNDWTMSVNYTAGSLNAPKSTTIDANGNVWVANSGNNTVTLLAQTGAPASGSPFTGNGLAAPAAVALDASGNAWVANKGGSTVSAFTATGGTVTGSPYTVGTAPTALAFDAAGNVFVANSGSSNVTELSASGTAVQTISTGVAAPSAIAINPK